MNILPAHQAALAVAPPVESLPELFAAVVHRVVDLASQPVSLFRKSIHFLGFETSNYMYRSCSPHYRRVPVRIDRSGASWAPERQRIAGKTRWLRYNPHRRPGWEITGWQPEA